MFSERVELKFLESLCSLPSSNVMISSKGGFSAEGNSMTVALLMIVPSVERSRLNFTVLVLFSVSAV